VLWIDRFGNAQINATSRHTGPGPLGLQLSGHPPINTRIVSSYGAIAPDAVALVVDSYGYLSVCSDRRSAAADLGILPGDRVRLTRDASGRR
jgi:S-adenosylmethionine hydrolase